MEILEGREKALVDEWETEMLVKALRVGTIKIFSEGLTREELGYTFADPADSVEEAVAASVEKQGDSVIAVVPEGPYVVPRFKENHRLE